MKRATIRRAFVAATTVLVLSAVAAFADTVPADGDAVTPGNQALVVLPDSAPGQVVTWPINFRLTCAGLSHAAPGATIVLDLMTATVPSDGAVSATSTTIGPVPDTWTASGLGCPSPAPTISANGPSIVSLTMPTTPGNGYLYSLIWSRAGTTGLTGTTAMTFQVDVVANTPPVLALPGFAQAEATSPGGAAVSWSATATDAEDSPPPTPTCVPASGSTFPIGSTLVECSVTDSGGLSDSGSFLVSVGDSTAPDLVGMPANQQLTTTDPDGTTLSYTAPTATDIADPNPSVDCVPASGSPIPVGTTTVTCVARDASGNETTASFTVAVTLVSSVTWSAVWGEPVGMGGATFSANTSRTIPVKVEIFADGVEQTSGDAVLTWTTCAGAAGGSVELSWDGGRWAGHLDGSQLGGPGCYTATASLDGNAAGSFGIDLKGDATPNSGNPKTASRR